MIADVKKLTSGFLRTHDAIVDLGARVVAQTPESRTTPWVRVTRLDGRNATRISAEHLVDFLVQYDCYAGATGGQPEATLLSRTVRAALNDDLPGVHDDAVVTSVRITGDQELPDDAFEPARARVVLTASIHVHTTYESLPS